MKEMNDTEYNSYKKKLISVVNTQELESIVDEIITNYFGDIKVLELLDLAAIKE